MFATFTMYLPYEFMIAINVPQRIWSFNMVLPPVKCCCFPPFNPCMIYEKDTQVISIPCIDWVPYTVCHLKVCQIYVIQLVTELVVVTFTSLQEISLQAYEIKPVAWGRETTH